MKNLKLQSQKLKVDLSDLGLYLRLVKIEYPHLEDIKELAEQVSIEFNVICTEKDIKGYHSLFVQDDYELESRRQEHGTIM